MINEIDLTPQESSSSSSSGPAAELRGVLLPVKEAELLLPNVTVAEVIGYREPDPLENSPDWLLGSINWKQRRVPIVMFEYFLNAEHAVPGYRARIALCHNLAPTPQTPYIGILCQSIPRLTRVDSASAEDFDTWEMLPDMVKKHVRFSQGEAWIPDMEKLCEQAQQQMFTA